MARLPTFMPSPLPEEHLLSTVARWLVLTGNKDVKDSLRGLTTNRDSLNPGKAFHPIYNDLFQLYGRMANREKLLSKHTLFPYYAPLMKFQQRLTALDIDKKLAERLRPQPLQGHLNFAWFWRWCPCCVQEDEKQHGVAYWHAKHQLPSVLSCYKHPQQILLKECARCGFNIRDLKHHPLPPGTNNCPSCGEVFGPKGTQNEVTDWLKSVSLQLMSQPCMKRPNYEFSMTHGVSSLLASTHFKRSAKNQLVVFEQLQQEFKRWFDSYQLIDFFMGSELEVTSPRILSIGSAAKFPRALPPMSHLMWMKFLGAPNIEPETLEARDSTTPLLEQELLVN
ncbi:TniQ family protein [Neiella marina]|uniref:TniQ family protein n=1 Tax=Neiella holothuriorum TaxID=2870530 RepID=A0ABS7EHV6_9GAMM|nr:TniQ family protein [Neiella holothuriorum]MBW8191819.1 TniQ family protein [Neiella holothuriorum]